MHHSVIAASLGVIWLLAGGVGCASTHFAHVRQGHRAHDIFTELANIDVVPRKGEPNAEYHARVGKAIQNAVARATSASELALLFYLCDEHLEHAPEVDQSRLQWIDPAGSAMETVLWRLGELRTEQSAKVLVRILADPSITIDGAISLVMREAIVAHGQACVPYLQRLAKGYKKAYVAEIIVCVPRTTFLGWSASRGEGVRMR